MSNYCCNFALSLKKKIYDEKDISRKTVFNIDYS